MGTRTGTRTALLVVDVQQANTRDGYQRTEVFARIRDLIDRAQATDVPVVWIQHETQDGPMDPGSPGWQIVTEIAPREGETVIAKRYLDSFADTSLGATLEDLEVGRLVVCGAATDACIRATTMRALVEGYDATLVSDAHTTDVGPWDLPLPDGRTVAVGAEQMIAFTNFFIADTEYPGSAPRSWRPRRSSSGPDSPCGRIYPAAARRRLSESRSAAASTAGACILPG